MRHLMWILTWIAVAIGGVLGAASVMILSASHQPAPQSPTAGSQPTEPPILGAKQKSGEPSRSLILASRRQSRSAMAKGPADALATE